MSLVLAHDKVVYLADTLILVIDDSVSAELAYAIAVLNNLDVDPLRKAWGLQDSRYTQKPKHDASAGEYRQAIPPPEALTV